MTPDAILKAIAPYEAEIANIRYFLREKRTMGEWQDWLWKRMPKLTRKTEKIKPSMMNLDDPVFKDPSIRYTNLLTMLVNAGMVGRCRGKHTTTYKWLDTA